MTAPTSLGRQFILWNKNHLWQPHRHGFGHLFRLNRDVYIVYCPFSLRPISFLSILKLWQNNKFWGFPYTGLSFRPYCGTPLFIYDDLRNLAPLIERRSFQFFHKRKRITIVFWPFTVWLFICNFISPVLRLPSLRQTVHDFSVREKKARLKCHLVVAMSDYISLRYRSISRIWCALWLI